MKALLVTLVSFYVQRVGADASSTSRVGAVYAIATSWTL